MTKTESMQHKLDAMPGNKNNKPKCFDEKQTDRKQQG